VKGKRNEMQVEKTEIWITCEKPLEGDGRGVRGECGSEKGSLKILRLKENVKGY